MATPDEILMNASLEQSLDWITQDRDRLKERLTLIERAAQDHVDGDSQPNDTYWSEIVGIAQGDPNWLQFARANYGKGT